MPTLVTDIRQLKKRRSIVATEKTSDTQQIPLVVESIERATPLDVALDRFDRINEAFSLLVNTLDLEPIRLNTAPGVDRLWQLAGQSIEGNRCYTRAEAIERIRIRTNVTTERATKGFELMVEAGAIEPTVDQPAETVNMNLFYLSGSTPY